MSQGRATLRITPVAPAIEALRAAVVASGSPARIAARALDAAAAIVPCAGGAVVVDARGGRGFEVLATTAPDLFPRGPLAPPIPHPAAAHVVPLRSAGVEFGRIILVDALTTGDDARLLLADVARHAAILGPMTEAAELHLRLREARSLVDVAPVLVGLLSADDVLAHLVHLAGSVVQGDRASLGLLTPDGETLVPKKGTGSLRSDDGGSIPTEVGLMSRAARTGQPVVTPKIPDDPRGIAVPSPAGPRVAVPVTIRGRVVGALLVGRDGGADPFCLRDVEAVERIAAYVAIAIHLAGAPGEPDGSTRTDRAMADEIERLRGELLRQQEQLVASERMAALGRVTAGIAHEINSPIGGIMNALKTARGYVDEYARSAADPEITAEDHAAIAADMSDALALAEAAVTKVGKYVRTIKAQTRPGEGEKVAFDPAEEVRATVAILAHTLRAGGVEVRVETDSGLELVGDQERFALLVQNLVLNAMDAYEGHPGEVRVRLAEHDGRVILEVSDDGCGIPDEIRPRIFDDLFTTKDVGKGTGLGLTMVRTVAADFGATVDVDSEVGRGTTFRLSLPRTETDD